MLWKKLGCVFNIKPAAPNMLSHAQLPVILPLVDPVENKYRVYFCSRDENTQSRPFCFEGILREDGFEVTKLIDQPLLELGRPGMFDDSGIMFSSWLEHENQLLMYYIGWTRRVKVPYQLSIGLATSSDRGVTFTRYSEGPLLTCNTEDTFCVTMPVIVKHEEKFVLLYGYSDGWVERGAEKELWYGLGVTESYNPFEFKGPRRHVHLFDRSFAYLPSSVVKLGRDYIIFLCVRGLFDFRNDVSKTYRVYYTKTSDFVNFTTPNLASGLDPTGEGFDATMAEYLCALETPIGIFGMYNGDGFGATGIGLAKLVSY